MNQHQWYFQENLSIGEGEILGPMNSAQVKSFIQLGKAKKKDFLMSPTGTQKQWVSISSIPEFNSVFEEARAWNKRKKAEEAQKARKEKDDRKRRNAETQRETAQEKFVIKAQKVEANRGTFIDKLFGDFSPSPYYGFDFQKGVIALLIVVIIVAIIVGTVLMAYGVVVVFRTENMDILAKALSILSCFVPFVAGFLSIVALVFFRNVIDWMIDMEKHAKELSIQLSKWK